MDEMMAWVEQYGEPVKPYIADTGRYPAAGPEADGKSILFEAQLGALRDLDYGIYPYTTSSNTIAAFAPVGSGLPGAMHRRGGGRGEGLFLLRGRGSLCLRVVRRGGRKAPGRR